MEYGEFSKVYDLLMYDYPYEEIYHYIEEILSRHKILPTRILEMACGTGALTKFIRRLAPVTAFDLSSDMLSVAREKLGSSQRVHLYCEDMSTFQLTQKFDLILCLCDSLNYLETKDMVRKTFQNVFDHLTDDGIFLFDINTEYKFLSMSDQVFTDEKEDIFYVWENFYSLNDRENIYRIHFFQREGEKYRRFFEEHIQYMYSEKDLDEMLMKIGFKDIQKYRGYTFDKDIENCHRLVYIVQKKEKE
ncbi:MAG: methyltransferase domain-containing protein [Tissierellia bacterium]|nr:methyltransferase domain-containing protein [Tissierellia bacterium]